MTTRSPGIQTEAFRDNRSARNGRHGHHWSASYWSFNKDSVAWRPFRQYRWVSLGTGWSFDRSMVHIRCGITSRNKAPLITRGLL